MRTALTVKPCSILQDDGKICALGDSRSVLYQAFFYRFQTCQFVMQLMVFSNHVEKLDVLLIL
jgi:hypothetical protein